MDKLENNSNMRPVTDRVATPHPVAGSRSSGAASIGLATESGVPVSQFLFGDDNGDEPDAGGDLGGKAESSSSAVNPPQHPLFQRLAPQIIEDVGPAGFKEWMRTEAPAGEWSNNRNLRECEVLADALDALVLRKDADLATEILARRFVGVRNADVSGNWNFATVLAKNMSKRTLLRPQVMSAVLREAKNMSLLENGGKAPAAPRNPNRTPPGAAANPGGHNGRPSTGAQTSAAPAANAANANRAGGGAHH
jgi:hypothetical protein